MRAQILWACCGGILLYPSVAPAFELRSLFESSRKDPTLAPLLQAKKTELKEAAPLYERYRGPLQDYKHLNLAKANNENPKVALEHLGKIDAKSIHYDEALEEKARLLKRTNPKEALAFLLSIPVTGDRLREAMYLTPAGPARRALQKRILVEAPASREAFKLARRLKPKGLVKRLDTKSHIERLHLLLRYHENQYVAQESAELLKSKKLKPEQRCAALYLHGKAKRKRRRYSAAISALSKARVLCAKAKQENLALRSALLEIRVRSIRGQLKAAKRPTDWITKTYPEHSFADDALLMYARALQSAKREKEAQAVFQRMLKEYPEGDQAALAAWRLAHQAIETKRPKKAIELLEKILTLKARTIDYARARYWLARLYEKSAPEKMEKAYEDAVLRPSFYAWVALARLRTKSPKMAKALEEKLKTIVSSGPRNDLVPPPSLVESPGHQRARLYAALGELDYAKEELQRLHTKALKDPEALALAMSFHHLGAYPEAQRILRSRKKTMLEDQISKDNLHIWRAAYSQPFLDLVQKAAKAEKLEPLLLLALVREESTFDPQIVSWAGATGLAQLMPATAVGAYASVHGGRLKRRRLTDPELNLRLGAHVLKDGLKKFKREPLALSAYNGGNRLTRRFIPKSPKAFDRWVEGVSVKETRRYIKRVVETWGIYRLLYDRSKPFIQLPKRIGG